LAQEGHGLSFNLEPKGCNLDFSPLNWLDHIGLGCGKSFELGRSLWPGPHHV